MNDCGLEIRQGWKMEKGLTGKVRGAIALKTCLNFLNVASHPKAETLKKRKRGKEKSSDREYDEEATGMGELHKRKPSLPWVAVVNASDAAEGK